MDILKIFENIDKGGTLSREEIKTLLALEDKVLIQRLFDTAYKIKLEYVGNKVYFRGLIELSNVCRKDCYYCGIRKSNEDVKRYSMTSQEIVDAAMWAYKNKYGSVVLQSGERTDKNFTDAMTDVVHKIKHASGGTLGITLCLGEQSPEVYKQWFAAGAHRYLLRIETSNPELYAKLHPADHSHAERLKCLKSLKEIGYQVGTGVMAGLPFQTLDDLAGDLLFFKENDIDMIGMGPYLVHDDTPLANEMPDFDTRKESQLELGLKMIAIARILLKDVNIASTTALQALDDRGREMGLKAGANIIMPNITDVKYRSLYQLYEDKPCLDDSPDHCKSCLKWRVESVGEKIAYDEWGDSVHFYERVRKAKDNEQ